MAGQNISHEGHRQRMRARVEQYGLESLAPHEALEYLLYITNARRDTNGIAHALLERFGSFAGVLEASEEELCRVPGVGPASARMLHLLPEVSRYYEHSRTSTEGALTTTERLAAYLKPRFAGAKQEKALLLSLDSRSRVKSVYWLKEGNTRMVSLEVKDVVSAALRGGTESVVLCHNHPNGVPLPVARGGACISCGDRERPYYTGCTRPLGGRANFGNPSYWPGACQINWNGASAPSCRAAARGTGPNGN